MSASATLGGIPLLALDTVGWRFTQGVAPYQRVFELKRSDADALMKASPPGTEVELVINSSSLKPLRVKALSVLSVAPATHPDRVSVLVADRRTWWDRNLVERRYNIRRRSGEYRLIDGQLQRINTVPDITFAKYSLQNELKPWTAEEIVKDVLNTVTLGRYDSSRVSFSRALDVDGLELQDDGATALKRVLDYVPSLTVYMNAEGVAVLTLTTGGEEGPQLEAAGPPIVGPHLSIDVDMQRSRPSAIEVYFQPEDEVRFDFLDGINQTSSSREPRLLRNVMPLPDRKLKIGDQYVVQNTLVEINQALLDAWNADTANPPSVTIAGRTTRLPPISFAIIQRLWMAKGGYHAYYEIAGGNSVWSRRWNAIKAHYRQTFQIDRRWRDRLRSAKAERVAIIDPENARRAPADVYGDHALIPSAKRLAKYRGDLSKKLAINQKAWDDINDAQRLIVNGHVAETAALLPGDADQMVFRVNYQPDQYGDTTAIIPSLLASKTDGGATEIPEADPRVARALFLLHLAQLATKHRFTTIVTVATASPNNLGSLYKLVVSPNDAKKVLPDAISRRIGPCKGPVMQLRVGAQIATARFAWKDEDAVQIEGCILDGKPRTADRLVDPDHLRNVANAMGALVYGLFADRVEGARVTALDTDRLPVGRIAAVVHELGTRGSAITRLEMPPHMASIDFMALLPESTRRQLFAKVQP